ncbi:MAG TPA: hypothetical protein VGD27_14910 [Longimicrobiales bacterium]
MRHRLILLLLAGAAACMRGDAAEKDEPHAAPAQANVQAIDTARALEPGELHAVVSAAVQGRTGAGGQPLEIALRTAPTQLGHSRRFGKRTLDISLRAGAREPGMYPCTSCHMGRSMVLTRERIADAHQDVQPVHPAETGATCVTCHAADNVEMLALAGGARASLDHAYLICAVCHNSQVEAWSQGAHGKRLDGWQGRRVVMNCADCHDPHAPALQPRMPFRPPRLHRRENDHE